jgi:flagellar hook-associated protein 2
MSSIDYIQALGAGASFDTKKIVEALVEAERAPARARIETRLATSDAKISGLGKAVSVMGVVKDAAQRLNDASDFKTFVVSNSQQDAFSASAKTSARAGSNNITVTQIAQEQRSVSGAFDSDSTVFNDGSAITLSLSLGTSNPQTTEISITSATLQSTVAAINEADLGITAEIVDTGGDTGNFRIQLIGETGAEQAFTLTSSDDSIAFSNVQTAADASLNVNGIDFTRSSNVIDDVLAGVTLTLNSATQGAASLGINQNNDEARANIVDFVAIYNEANRQLEELANSTMDGPLAGDSIFRSLTRQLKSVVLNSSSTPGLEVRNLSDMGIAVNKTGQLEIDDTKLDNALANNYDDVITAFTANTDDQSDASTAVAGIAGDLSKVITQATAANGYLVSQQESLRSQNSAYQEDLTDLETRMERIEERYTRQFLAMSQIIDQMNSTKESMTASFENLPFSNRD